MLYAMLEWLSVPSNYLGALLGFSIIFFFLAGRNGNGNGLLQYYSFMTPITFTLAAYEVAKNVGWSSNDQILFLTGIFFGCYGLVRPPRLEGK